MKSPVALLFLALGLIGGLAWVLLGGAPDPDPGADPTELEWAAQRDGEPGHEVPADAATAVASEAGERSEVEGEAPAVPSAPAATGLRGRVVRAIGGPVVGARVTLRVQNRMRRGQAFAFGARGGRPEAGDPVDATTGSRGEFVFDRELARGARFSLVVTHRDHAAAVVSHRMPRGDEVPEGLTVREGSLDVGEIAMKVGATVRGRVVTADGYALPQARVAILNSGRWRGPRGADRGAFEPVSVDANGMFVMRHVNAGSYRFEASAAEWQKQQTEETALAEGAEVDLGNIELEPGCAVTGIVVSASDGKPVARASVSLAFTERRRRERPTRATTDKEGRFTIDHLPRGKADLTINARGFLDYTQAGLELQQTKNATFGISPGLMLRGVVVDSSTARPVTRYSVTAERIGDLPNPERDAARTKLIADASELFAGAGANRAGAAAAGNRAKIGELMAKVRELRSATSGIRTSRFGRRARPQKVRDEAGQFEIEGLQEGRYVVRVTSEAHAEQLSQPVELRIGVGAAAVRVAVDAGVAIRGRVVDAEGQPIRGVRLELSTRRAPRAPTTNSGRVQRWASMLSGQRDARRGRLSTRTRKDGSFAFDHVTPGEYRLNASAKGWSDGGIPELTITGARDDLSLTLGALASIHGTVAGFAAEERGTITVAVAKIQPATGATDAGARGRRGAIFGGFGGGGFGGGGFGGVKTTKVDADGNYRIQDLEPGEYAVRAIAGSMRNYLQARVGSGLANLAADVRLVPGGEVEHDLAVDRIPTGTVTGTVWVNGQLAAGARISLRPVAEQTGASGAMRLRSRFGGSSASVNGDGQFELKGVLPGAYTLEVRKTRRSRTAIHRRPLQVGVGTMAVRIAASTGELKGTVALPSDAGEATLESFRPRATLLRDVAALPTGDALRSAFRNSGGSVTVGKDGAFSFDEVATGAYFLVISGRGRQLVGQPVTISGPASRPVAFTLGAKLPEGAAQPPSGRGPRAGGFRGGRDAGARGPGGRGAGGRGPGGRGAGGRGAGGRGAGGRAGGGRGGRGR